MTDRDDTTATATRLNAELLAMVRIASTILQYTSLDDILAAITRELSQLIELQSFSRHLAQLVEIVRSHF